MSDPLFARFYGVMAEEVVKGRTATSAVVLGRNPDGTQRVLAAGGSCEVREGRLPQGTGDTVVTTPPGATPIRARPDATAGPGLARSSGTLPPRVWVESIDPSTFEQGFAGSVAVTGEGFLAGMVFQFELQPVDLNLEPEPHPGIAVTSVSILDTQNAVLEVEVDADAQLVAGAPLGYGFGGTS